MARRSKLRISDDGCCANHPCDGCDRCLAGDCCGSDVGEANLPLEGSWPFTQFGDLGVIVYNAAGALQCHACGQFFVELGRHCQRHNLTADGYRAMFGLNCGTALVSADISEARRENGRRVYALGMASAPPGATATSEQRSKWSYKRESRAQRRRERADWMDSDHQSAAAASKAGDTPDERQSIYRAKRRMLEVR